MDNIIHVNDDWRGGLYESITRAEKFIYISVPSLNPNMLLALDGGDESKQLTIGELLHVKYRIGKTYSIMNGGFLDS